MYIFRTAITLLKVGKPLMYSLLPSYQIDLHIAVVYLALLFVSRVIPVAPTSAVGTR